jgi:phosphate:Na+ symporter
MEALPTPDLDLWRLMAGLGIFLFGMFQLQEGIEALSGRTFQRMVQRSAATPLRAALTGLLAAAVLQSSSAVSLMVLAFAGAGVLGMGQAIGVVVGSNLGTTGTAWVVATLGFRLDIESFSLPFIAVGGLGLIFLGTRPRYAALTRMLAGFGFLFMGLSFMKDATEAFAAAVGPASLQGTSDWVYLAVGIGLTAMLQSSSASIAILLSVVHSGMAGLFPAALFVLGANIGTTLTALLGSLAGKAVRRRIAVANLLFNAGTVLLVLPVLAPFLALIRTLMPRQPDAVLHLALFHSLYNGVGVLLYLPFATAFGRLVERLVPDRSVQPTRFISRMPARVGGAAAEALRKESWHLFTEVLRFHGAVLGSREVVTGPFRGEDARVPDPGPLAYRELKEVGRAMHDFAEELHEESLDPGQGSLVNRSLFAARMELFSAKWMKDLREEFEAMEAEDMPTETLRTDLSRRQGIMVGLLQDYFAHPVSHEEAYQALKARLKELDHEGERRLAAELADAAPRHGFATAHHLTVNKTWYLAWRNLLLALRELDLGAEEEG